MDIAIVLANCLIRPEMPRSCVGQTKPALILCLKLALSLGLLAAALAGLDLLGASQLSLAQP